MKLNIYYSYFLYNDYRFIILSFLIIIILLIIRVKTYLRYRIFIIISKINFYKIFLFALLFIFYIHFLIQDAKEFNCFFVA